MDYDIIYGVDLGEYLRFHNKSKEKLIEEIETDIEILQENYQKYAQRNRNLNDDELSIIYNIRNLIEKKRKHLERIKRW